MASTIVVDKIQKTGGVAFTLPVADGNAGQSLQTDGSLALSWGDVDPIVAKGGDIASASPTVIPDGNLYYDVTGTTGFSAFTVTAGRHFILQFDAGLVMTHHADNLDLPGEASITTVAGDVAEFVATATNKAQCINYTRASGKPVITDFANADINASAAIAQSKLVDIVNADVDASAAIAQSKLVDVVNADVDAAAGIAVTKIAAMPYDIGFTAGFDADLVKEDVAVATYGEMVVARALTIVGETAYVDTAPTGATLIMDIMKDGTTIYASTKPLIAISANTHTVGVATTTALVAGSRLTFKITQIGSTEPGEGVRFTLRCKSNTNE